MAQLLLGPVLRYVGEHEATVWVEADAPCEVEVLGCRERTFHVAGHHYALVHVTGLRPGAATPYEVALDGERRWPQGGRAESRFPPSAIPTAAVGGPTRIVFGSCRVTAPHEPPYTLRKDEDGRGREVDALRTLALRLAAEPADRLPTLLLLLGDQVYADEVSPGVRELIEARRDPTVPPGVEVADFEEYTALYREAWGEPVVRWLLSTVPTAMVFDDHDVHDDWNISEAWVRDARAQPWWEDRIAGAFASYWIHQHLGNLQPEHVRDDGVLDAVRAAPDGFVPLRAFALRADRQSDGTRWSFCRDHGGVRVLVVDSRAGRVLRDGRRCMVDDDEWRWICERLVGGHDHLVVATSLPLLLGHGMHYLEAWSEAVCDGAWGGRAARLGERLRRAVDLEHWAAFGESFERLTTRLREVGAGRHGPAPASIVVVSGDVHHAYLAEVAFRRGQRVRSAVWQAVCSPLRNPLDARERRAIRLGGSRAGHAAGRALARAAGVGDPDLRWRVVEGPVFDNQVATLEFDGRRAGLTVERARPADGGTQPPGLERAFARALA